MANERTCRPSSKLESLLPRTRKFGNKAGRSRRQSPRVYGLLTDNQLFFFLPRTIMARHIYNYKTFNFAIDVDHICIRGIVYLPRSRFHIIRGNSWDREPHTLVKEIKNDVRSPRGFFIHTYPAVHIQSPGGEQHDPED